MVEIFEQKIEDIKKEIKTKESETALWQIEQTTEELWLDVKIWAWLKNDQKMLNYSKLYLKKSPSIWESFKLQFLELRLSIVCPYFKDFKVFLSELKKWEDTSEDANENSNQDVNQNEIDVIWEGDNFLGTDISEIESQPFYKNPDSWVTRCAATARFNALDFWIDLPWWNAYDAWEKPGSLTKKTIPQSRQNEKPSSSWPPLNKNQFPNADSDINFADLYTSSSSWYWHRVVGFKDSNWQWYVLDPYTRVNWVLNSTPKKLEKYMEKRKVIKSHFYKSSGYKFESRNYA